MPEQTQRRLERLVIFDGDCAFCSGFFRRAVSLVDDTATAFVASRSKTGQKLLRRLGLPDNPSTVYVIKRGTVLKKSTAVLDLVRSFRHPYHWLRVLAVLPSWLRDWLYDIVARVRRFFPGRNLQQCALSPKQQKYLIGDDNSDWAVVEDFLGS